MQLALVFDIGWTLSPGRNWLMALPLASIAVDRLLMHGSACLFVADVPLGTGNTPYNRLSDWMGWGDAGRHGRF